MSFITKTAFNHFGSLKSKDSSKWIEQTDQFQRSCHCDGTDRFHQIHFQIVEIMGNCTEEWGLEIFWHDVQQYQGEELWQRQDIQWLEMQLYIPWWEMQLFIDVRWFIRQDDQLWLTGYSASKPKRIRAKKNIFNSQIISVSSHWINNYVHLFKMKKIRCFNTFFVNQVKSSGKFGINLSKSHNVKT